jgi:hypothetical protein
MRAALPIAFCIGLTACAAEEFTVAMYGEGTGDGEIRIENDEGQVVVGGMDATSTAEGALAAGSQIVIHATPHAGSHFTSFGGDCAGDANPLSLELERPIRCAVKFDKD